jgi:hypothetical protein
MYVGPCGDGRKQQVHPLAHQKAAFTAVLLLLQLVRQFYAVVLPSGDVADHSCTSQRGGGGGETEKLLRDEASPSERDGHAREKDAGRFRSGATDATEDALSRRPVRCGGQDFVIQLLSSSPPEPPWHEWRVGRRPRARAQPDRPTSCGRPRSAPVSTRG